MRFLFELSHPKHFYQFRALIEKYKKQGHKVEILARDKDVLFELLSSEGYSYKIPGKHSNNLLGKFFVLPKLIIKYLLIVIKFKPDFILSKASPYAVLMRPFTKAKIVITPDSEVVQLTKKFVAPGSHLIITPDTYAINYGEKHKRINGFFEEAYLAPNYFTPDTTVLNKYQINHEKPYYILRFVGWNANHDVGHHGFASEEKIKLVNFLLKYGEIYISAEPANIPSELLPYLLKINVNDIHHLLYFSNGYIGDSQTMATESALLGTPSFRFNSFVGINDMSNFNILQHEYKLLYNYSNFDELLKSIKNALNKGSIKREWKNKRDKYFRDKPDINKQLIEYVNKMKK